VGGVKEFVGGEQKDTTRVVDVHCCFKCNFSVQWIVSYLGGYTGQDAVCMTARMPRTEDLGGLDCVHAFAAASKPLVASTPSAR